MKPMNKAQHVSHFSLILTILNPGEATRLKKNTSFVHMVSFYPSSGVFLGLTHNSVSCSLEI